MPWTTRTYYVNVWKYTNELNSSEADVSTCTNFKCAGFQNANYQCQGHRYLSPTGDDIRKIDTFVHLEARDPSVTQRDEDIIIRHEQIESIRNALKAEIDARMRSPLYSGTIDAKEAVLAGDICEHGQPNELHDAVAALNSLIKSKNDYNTLDLTGKFKDPTGHDTSQYTDVQEGDLIKAVDLADNGHNYGLSALISNDYLDCICYADCLTYHLVREMRTETVWYDCGCDY